MSTTRITGLASGMDTESIIEELMKAARTPLDSFERKKTTISWQREAILDVNSKLLEFQNTSFDMKLQGTYKVYDAESSDSSVLSATATTEAIEGTYTISASQLATSTKFEGGEINKIISSTTGFLKSALDLRGKEFSITLNGETKKISFAADDDTANISQYTSAEVPTKLSELLSNKINNAFGSEQIVVDVASAPLGRFKLNMYSESALNLPITVTAGDTGSDALSIMNIESGSNNIFDTNTTIKDYLGESGVFVDGKFSLTVNDQTFEFSETQTLSEVFKTISNDEDLDVSMKYDSIAKKVIMQRKSSGAGREIEVSDTANLCGALGLVKGSGESVYTIGKNAVVDITDPEGRTISDIQMTSNTFTFQGVSFKVNKANTEATVTVGKDVDAIYDKIVQFADKFNTILETLNKAYNEEKTDYAPLTDKEREGLSETQEENWEKLAKQGLLRRDSTLKTAITQMRQAVISSVNTDAGAKTLFDIGINTSSYDAINTENNGKLIIDEDALKEAIRNDLDSVVSIFTDAPQNIQGDKFDDGEVLALTGKSMQLTLGGNTQTITFNRDYDLSISADKDAFEDYINGQFDNYFGAGQLSASISSGKFILTSINKADVTVDSGDALETLNIEAGDEYDSSERGFALKLYDAMKIVMADITEKAGSSSTAEDDSTWGKKIERINDEIAKQADKLDALEDKYYSQFSAMETAISNMNAQSNSITNMLGSK